MPEMVTNSSTSLRSSLRTGKIDVRYVAGFSLLVLMGGAATLYPIFSLGCLTAAIVLGICWLVFSWVRRARLDFWQIIALLGLSGYLVLNYGFDNLAVHVGGFPILISYGLMYVALMLAVFRCWDLVVRAVPEPAVLCALGVLMLASFHMVTDIPSYGAWAFRDCTMCFDSLFLLMGLVWAMKNDSIYFLAKWLMFIFVVNMVYSFTLPWGETLWSWSPVSGAFLQVPVLGNYNGAGDLLFAGAMFCICVGRYVISRPRWLTPFLAVTQLLGITITQVRRMYVGIVVVILILILVGEIKKFANLLVLVLAAIAVLFVVTTLGGLEITGRIGPVNPEFFRDHIRSMSGTEVEDTPGSSMQSRITMSDEAIRHFLAHPVFGEGFGRPLLDAANAIDETTGAITRMPHNSSLTYLARLGSVGFVGWIGFHFCVLTRFFYAFRQRHCCDKRLYAMALWFFLFYVIFMIGSFVEGPFEYPSRAIPFYFLMGSALGMIRWHLRATPKGNSDLPALGNSVEKAYLQSDPQLEAAAGLECTSWRRRWTGQEL
jgi:O-Antigen ligase